MDHHFEFVADAEFFRLDDERKLAEGQNALGLAADVDEQLVLIFCNDDADENLAFVENLEALFVQPLLERELVFFFLDDCSGNGRIVRCRRLRRDGSRNGVCASFVLILFLAATAPPGTALTENRPDDGFPASSTRFAQPAVNVQLILEPAFEPFGVDVVVDAGTPRLNGAL
jgi:hypothetical protein